MQSPDHGDDDDEGKTESIGEESDEEGDETGAASLIDPALDEYEAGKYSPVYMTQEDLEPGSIVISEADDVSKLHVDQVSLFLFLKQCIEPPIHVTDDCLVGKLRVLRIFVCIMACYATPWPLWRESRNLKVSPR